MILHLRHSSFLLLAFAALSWGQAQAIEFSKDIPLSMRQDMKKDLSLLENVRFKNSKNSPAQKLMGLESLTAQSAQSWLKLRVRYIVGQDAFASKDAREIFFAERLDVTFPNGHILPYALKQQSLTPPKPKNNASNNPPAKTVTIMRNVGTSFYLDGKGENYVLGVNISTESSQRPIPVAAESPRVGIIQMGAGLFSPIMMANKKRVDSPANSILRLATLFHEARHSDGHGTSLGFLHSPCPEGHDMAGTSSCDESLNGAYSIDAAMTIEMAKACDTCTVSEKEVLRVEALDALNRVLKISYKGSPTTHWDDAPEGL